MLRLYDPDRSQAVTYRRRDPALGRVRRRRSRRAARRRSRRAQGAGLRILTEPVTSPTLAQPDPGRCSRRSRRRGGTSGSRSAASSVRAGARWRSATPVDAALPTSTRPTSSSSLDADFLGSGPGSVRYARDFASGRRVRDGAAGDEPALRRRDHRRRRPARWPITGCRCGRAEIEAFARALAAGVGDRRRGGPPPADAGIGNVGRRRGRATSSAHRGAGSSSPASTQPAAVHALAHAINEALGNVGATVVLHRAGRRPSRRRTTALARASSSRDMDAGKVEVLVILGGNPVYTAPADLDFAERAERRSRSASTSASTTTRPRSSATGTSPRRTTSRRGATRAPSTAR